MLKQPDEQLPQQVFTTGEAAKICKLSQQTIIRCFDSGILKGFRIPGSRFRKIPRDSLVQFIRDHGLDMLESAAELVPQNYLILSKIIETEEEVRNLLMPVSHRVKTHFETGPTFGAGQKALEPGVTVFVEEGFFPDPANMDTLHEKISEDSLFVFANLQDLIQQLRDRLNLNGTM